MLHILLDTDIGNDMDDMQALAYLLSQSDADILGITTVTSEAIARAELADMTLRLAERGGVPIHAGSENPLSGAFRQTHVTPREKALLDDFPHRADFAADTAVDFLRRTIEAHPHEITLCCIDPLTSIARLFRDHPHIPGLLKTLVIMGGRFGEVDTARWGVQEWNILNDPEAAKIVFDAPVREAFIFGVELTSRVFRTDVARVALFDDAGLTFARGRISVTDTGDTRFAPDENGAHHLMTAMDNDLFFSHFFKTLGIEPVAE